MKWNRSIGPLILIIMAAMVIQAVQANEEPAELKNETVKIQEIVKNESAFDKVGLNTLVVASVALTTSWMAPPEVLKVQVAMQVPQLPMVAFNDQQSIPLIQNCFLPGLWVLSGLP